ncbi:MAG: hypothetical protein AMXMBFR82_32880 [Candidatus Hydrogenedentota bacterium]
MRKFQRSVAAAIFAGLIMVGLVPCVAHAGYILLVTGEETSGSSTVDIMRGSSDVGNIRVKRSLSVGTDKWGESLAEVELENTSNFTATIPVENGITAYTKWEWTHDGEDSTALYRFECDIEVDVYADAALDIESLFWGCGKIVTNAWAKIECDTATTDGKVSEKSVWAGVEVINDSGGLTGIGGGLTEASISWSVPSAQNTSPGQSYHEIASVTDTDDDPGSQCFVILRTKAWAKVYETRDTTDDMYKDKSKAFAKIDTSYPDLDLEGPWLK